MVQTSEGRSPHRVIADWGNEGPPIEGLGQRMIGAVTLGAIAWLTQAWRLLKIQP